MHAWESIEPLEIKMAEEILNSTTKSGTSSQRITEIFDLSRDV